MVRCLLILVDLAPTITFRLIELPEYQQLEYHETFEQLHGFALEIHSKLPIFACYMHEDVLRRLYTLVSIMEVETIFNQELNEARIHSCSAPSSKNRF